MFLLDEHHLEDSVQDCDYGKAVTVHSRAELLLYP